MARGEKRGPDDSESSTSKRRRAAPPPRPADNATDACIFREAWRVFRGAGWSTKRPHSRSLDTRYKCLVWLLSADLGGAGVGTVVVAELEWFEPVPERLIMVASVIALLASELEWLVVVAVAVAAVPVMSLVAERHLYTKNK
ncbi:hypothetical protein PF001_g3907 [Phytophthora fragariae]|uniref:Uncharacterized protein n=1 Tax=Phytophthora fragariae TaxID=53985 RepID=A0A6A4EC81_9STRA|nr:hypothetical protein PF001_g3907 [Phytophthora fragariae]